MRDWNLRWDMTGDGAFTISDVAALLTSLYHYPGDALLRSLIGTGVGDFLELTSEHYGGFGSAFFASFVPHALKPSSARKSAASLTGFTGPRINRYRPNFFAKCRRITAGRRRMNVRIDSTWARYRAAPKRQRFRSR